MHWSERLQQIDSRWLYLALAVAVAIPAFVRVPLPIPASPETRGVYDAVERVPPGRLVMLHPTWDAGTVGECEGQWHAVVEHLMRRGTAFVVWTSNPASPPFYNRIIAAAARRYGRVYGLDWVDFGYKVPGDQLKFGVQAMARDFPGFMQKDVRGTPVERLPILRGVKDATSFDLAISVGYNPTTEFLQFVQAVYGTKIAFGVAAIHYTTEISHLDSHQIVGMLVGTRGGAEYEVLLGVPGKGVEILTAQSFAHLLIFVAVVVANLAMLASRRAARGASA